MQTPDNNPHKLTGEHSTKNDSVIGSLSGTADGGAHRRDVFTSAVASDTRYSAVFEDNGTVAYAYLLVDNKIAGDVWLYNDGDPPDSHPWADRSSRPPFANPKEFVRTDRFQVVQTSDEVRFNWEYAGDGAVIGVQVWIREQLHARITPGSKPGWCRLAGKDSPVARRLHEQ